MPDLRVGIIGANARGGWAGESHVPAAQSLNGLCLAAVATNSVETAEEAAHKFGVEKAYGDGHRLIGDPEIDVVAVATRVPDHRNLVMAAIAAGKHVYSEWPLGRSHAESKEMADTAERAGIHDAVGLQLRGSPAIIAARTMVAAGSLGRLLSIRGFSSVAGFGPDVPEPFAYLEDPANFANLVTIQGAHTLDLVGALAGSIENLSALGSRQWPDIRVGKDKQSQRRETFDHLLAHGRLQTGVPFNVEVVGGRPPDDAPFWFELVGETGSLRLCGNAPRGLQSGRVRLSRDGQDVPVDEGELSPFGDAAINVAGVYASLRDDVRNKTRNTTGFAHATRLAGVIETAFLSSESGKRLNVNR